MLEDKLRNIKNEVVKRLEQREMEHIEYYKTVHELLVAEELAKGEYKIGNHELAITTAVHLRPKIGLVYHHGVEKTYVALKDKELSLETKQDLRNLSNLIDDTRSHLSGKLKDKVVTDKEFYKMVGDYVADQKAIAFSDDFVRAGSTGWVRATLKREFNVVDEPVVYDGIQESELRKAIDKL